MHVDSSGKLLSLNPVASDPYDAAVGPDGKIYITHYAENQITAFDPSTGNETYFAYSPYATHLTWSVAGDLWVGSEQIGAEEFDQSGNLLDTIDDYGTTAAEPAVSGNIWTTETYSDQATQYSPDGSVLTSTGLSPSTPSLAVLGDVPAGGPTGSTGPVYSFQLSQGETPHRAGEPQWRRRLVHAL